MSSAPAGDCGVRGAGVCADEFFYNIYQRREAFGLSGIGAVAGGQDVPRGSRQNDGAPMAGAGRSAFLQKGARSSWTLRAVDILSGCGVGRDPVGIGPTTPDSGDFNMIFFSKSKLTKNLISYELS
ncbi:hypothetical protein JIN84_05560 [Luteolibacter yonseiensis]|uniref:Uncharacterized protein n=1 Tax=Luteolibacter yonseiensis TaxID=1144680 RepID=A0A934R1K1_9BACT|nr:hypothetical protein [Luteolibacter yonseiensis]MBK1815067.1 hypothetical protein [Luteolibacter yonseiensis]